MKKSIFRIVGAIVISSALCGCSMTGEPVATVEPIEEPAIDTTTVLNVYGDYGLVEGFFSYDSPDGAFSIQLPEGSTVNDADPLNVVMSIAGTFANPDTIIIAKNDTPSVIDSTAALMELLKEDNSIDITGYFTLMKDGEYEGYKYTYTSVDDPQLKGIKSVYFSADGTAYEINATIYNGGDEANVSTINTITDTFINRL